VCERQRRLKRGGGGSERGGREREKLGEGEGGWVEGGEGEIVQICAHVRVCVFVCVCLGYVYICKTKPKREK